MRGSQPSSLPRNRRLRRTVARLLIAVPTLSLTACTGGDDGGCIPFFSCFGGSSPSSHSPPAHACTSLAQEKRARGGRPARL